MISNQILQNTIEGLKAITKVDLGVLDPDGRVLATTFKDIDASTSYASPFVKSQAESQMVSNFQFFKIFDEYQLEYVLVARGTTEEITMIGRIACLEVSNLIVAYKERFDKDNFVKNLLLDNLLLVDIYNRAKKLHIDNQIPRVVFLVETKYREGNDMELLRSVFGARNKDFVTAVDEKNVIIVKEVENNESLDDLRKIATSILDVLGPDSNARIAYGSVVPELKEVSKSYKEARTALDVAKIFFEEERVIAYASLGIGRLIYQLPMSLCKMFIKEIFGKINANEFDQETLMTINKFFENNLNVSETSRQLYIHRNTLVYRLDKLQKITGLDLRVFEDAITFKIALMVVKYMKYMDSLEY
ncbi:MAG: helix-turn-helix domain-containing protein [Lachnospiraceae bacterium]|nr:helix-turn-helix domain-containing protein [Lachnospiraceae bacterium]